MFAVAAMLKNEAPRIREWLEHYVAEGCAHVFLVDNGSTDALAEALDPYRAIVTVVRDSRRFERTQAILLNAHVLGGVRAYEWVLVCDVDEYLYAPVGTVASVLAAYPPKVEQIWVPWKVFGGAGHVTQPSGIVASFTRRAADVSLPYKRVRAGLESHLGTGKMLTRTRRLAALDVHESTLLGPSRVYTADGRLAADATAGLLPQLQLNHYMFMSREFYREVKCVRGGGNTGVGPKYTLAYYDAQEPHCNGVEDSELAQKRGAQKRGALAPSFRPAACAAVQPARAGSFG